MILNHRSLSTNGFLPSQLLFRSRPSPCPFPPFHHPLLHSHHQANLGTAGGVKSLLQRWVEAVLRRFTDWTIWPVETLGMDDLLGAFEDREQRDACSLVYTLTINTASKAVTRIQVDSKAGSGTCRAPLLTTSTATLTGSSIAGPVASAGARSYNVPLAANTGRVTLDTSGLAW